MGRSVSDTVVCLHSNASSSAQWRALAGQLGARFEVRACDGYGVGSSPDWPRDLPARLEEEVRLLEPVFEQAGDRLHLVGHSYGAAVALVAAVGLGRRLRSVAVYEPTLFALVAGDDPLQSPVAGIWRAATDAAASFDRGDANAAGRCFVDFWNANGSWAAMPEFRRAAVRAAVRHVGRWRDATFAPELSNMAFTTIEAPVLLMWGERSPESSLSVAARLATMLRRVTCAPLAGLGHMGPIAEPERVNARISAFLDLHRGSTLGCAAPAVDVRVP